jgi:1,5-anhydro-D-fructose reductase (1,5-anhydro-D-mannitol-forming)
MRRVGVVGVWHVHAADYVDEAMRRDDVTIVGVWDRDHKAALAFAEPRGLRVVPELEILLGDPSIDVIVVDTATSDHVDVVTASLDAGKNVFCEKVLAFRPEDAADLEALALHRGLTLAVSFQRLAEAWVPTLDAVVKSGILGRITSSRIRYQHAGAIDGWLPSGFLSATEAGGGAVIDLGVHGFYLSQLFHGEYPTTVTCRVSDISGHGIDDNSVVVLDYADGALSVLETSLTSGPDNARWCEIHGTRGVAVVDPRDETVYVRRSDAPDWVAQEMLPASPTPLEHFFSVLDGHGDNGWNRVQSVRLVALVAAAYESVSGGVAVVVSDPVG